MPPSDYVYVPRPEDHDLLERLGEGDAWINVVAPKTLGKSSLVQRVLGQVGRPYVFLDVSDIQEDGDARSWFAVLRSALWMQWTQAALPNRPPSQPADGPVTLADEMMSLFEAMRDAVAGPIVVALDEMAWLKRSRFGYDVAQALKRVHDQRHPRLAGISLCLISITPVNELWTDYPDRRLAPFAVTMSLKDFDASTNAIRAITAGFPRPTKAEGVVGRILEHTGGQPLLTMILADRAARAGLSSEHQVDSLVERYLEEQLYTVTDPFAQIDEHLARPGHYRALTTYSRLLEGNVSAFAEGAEILRQSGLVRGTRDGLEIKGPIFRRYFDSTWVDRAIARAATAETVSQHIASPVLEILTRGRRERICVISTGGTIGMKVVGEHVASPPKPEEFLNWFPAINEIALITPFALTNRDSININPPEWADIAKYIFDHREDGYAGFVVAHGTDTMAYSASAVAFALGEHLSFPVVFTGSQTTPDFAHGDALSNLYRACLVALQPIPEVVICFGDYVFRACRAQKKDDRRFDAFESPTYPPLAYITMEVEVQRRHVRGALRDAAVRHVQVHTGLLRQQEEPKRDMVLRNRFAQGVLHVVQSPGVEPEFFYPALELRRADGERLCRGMILQTPGAGNVATEPPFDYIPFIRKAAFGHNIPVLIIGQYPAHPRTYMLFNPSRLAVENGAIYAGDMTAAAATAKFRWLLAQVRTLEAAGEQDPAERRRWVETQMKHNYVGERDDPAEFEEPERPILEEAP